MKILHTSDWHLGKKLEQFSRLEEQKDVLAEISEIADQENVDAVLIAGDLFDTFNPSTDAIDLFYKTLKKLSGGGKRAIIAIAGNHDSPDRIEAPNPLARECGIIFSGYPNTKVTPFELESGLKVTQSEQGFLEILLPENKIPLRVITTPYANESRLKTFLGAEATEEEIRNLLQSTWQEIANNYCDNKGVNLLITHLFMTGKGETPPAEPEDEKPILHVGGAQVIYTENIPEQIQYTALGHLHRKIIYSKKNPVVYSGSPLSYSFSESDQDKYIMLVELEPGKSTSIKELRLKSGKRLFRKTFSEISRAVEWLTQNQNTLVELTIISETFITADEKKQLLNAHKGILNIIPEIKNSTGLAEQAEKIDLSKSMTDLFIDYFKFRHNGQDPNEEILQLLKEVLAEEESE